MSSCLKKRKPLLDIQNLTTSFGHVRAVEGLNLTLNEGEVLGIVGESGSGKSVTALSVMGLISPSGRVTGGQINYFSDDGKTDLLKLTEPEMRRYRGKHIGLIFQEPFFCP